MSEVLRLCPFCGKQPRRSDIMPGGTVIYCEQCGIELPIREWNTRPSAEPGEGEVAPIAWRYRYVYQDRVGGWTLRASPIEERPRTASMAGVEVEALYPASLSPRPPMGEEGVEQVGAVAASEAVADRNLRHLREAVERRTRACASTLESLRYLVNNPSAWSNYDDGVSELIREALSPRPPMGEEGVERLLELSEKAASKEMRIGWTIEGERTAIMDENDGEVGQIWCPDNAAFIVAAVAYARAALSLPREGGERGAIVGWQPIETAPKDGPDLDLWCAPLADSGAELTPCRLPNCCWLDGAWYMRSTGGGHIRVWHRVTHWRFPPTPPALTLPEERVEGGGAG